MRPGRCAWKTLNVRELSIAKPHRQAIVCSMILRRTKHKPSQMFHRDIPRARTDQYLSDDRLAADPRARHTDETEQALVRRKIVALAPGSRVLDVPCGNGRMSRLVEDRGDLELVALDFNFSMLESMRLRGTAPMLRRRGQADILHLPLRDKSVDLLLNVRLLHHIPDGKTRLAMLREIARVTRGDVLTSFWTTHCWRHVRKRLLGKAIKLYPISPACFRALCEEAGLVVQRLVPVRRWHDKQTLAICQPTLS